MANGAVDADGGERVPSRTLLIVVGVVALIVGIDQLTKSWAVSQLADGPKSVIGDFLTFDLADNSGSAFSGFQGYTPILAILAIVITVVIVRTVRQTTDRWMLVGLTLVLGGALGNLCDRLFRAPGFLRGHVIDFVSVGSFPVFNVADSCITIGAIILIARTLFAPNTTLVQMTNDATGDEIVVPAALDGERVDRTVALLTGWPRAAVQELLDAGTVLVDGRNVAKSHRLREGSVIEILGEPEPDALPAPEPEVAVDVRFADDEVIVVAKPAGLVVHPGAGHATGTLVNGLLGLYPEVAGVGEPMRPGIVHRLDRDTSGLLMVARSARAYDALVEQLATRAVDRHYMALVWGRLPSPRGVIDAPIGRSESRRTRMAIRESGKPARTAYEVRATYEDPQCSLLDCQLETGRTHQIRVHLSATSHPVVGDGTYGGSRDNLPLSRPFLHATSLAFDHPVSGERLAFTDPLPAELQTALDGLDQRAAGGTASG